MYIEYFAGLDNFTQTEILYAKGIFLGKRKLDSASVFLYELEDFYVEVFYAEYRRNILKVNCFRNSELLTPYLTGINIEELIKIS